MRRTSQQAEPIREATVTALERLLDPLLELLLDVGLSVRELNQIIRSQAVRVASRRVLKETGRCSNSRVAISTGIPRSEISRLSRFCKSGRKSNVAKQPARRILSGWYNDPKFLNSDGEPTALPIFGRRLSFEKLVLKYGAGIPVRAMLDELVQIDAVQRLPNQRLKPKTRVPISVGLTPSAIEAAGDRCRDLLGTLTKNIRRLDTPMFEATSLIWNANPTRLPIIRREITEQGTNFINATSSMLKRSQLLASRRSSTEIGQRVGVTVYYFEESAVAPPNALGNGKYRRRKNLRRR